MNWSHRLIFGAWTHLQNMFLEILQWGIEVKKKGDTKFKWFHERIVLGRNKIPVFFVSHPRTKKLSFPGENSSYNLWDRTTVTEKSVIVPEDNEHALNGQRCSRFSQQKWDGLRATALFLTNLEPCWEQEKEWTISASFISFFDNSTSVHYTILQIYIIHLLESQIKTSDIHVMRETTNWSKLVFHYLGKKDEKIFKNFLCAKICVR